MEVGGEALKCKDIARQLVEDEPARNMKVGGGWWGVGGLRMACVVRLGIQRTLSLSESFNLNCLFFRKIEKKEKIQLIKKLRSDKHEEIQNKIQKY